MARCYLITFFATTFIAMSNAKPRETQNAPVKIRLGSKPPVAELRGSSFHPKPVTAAKDLSDWDLFGQGSGVAGVGGKTVKQIRLYGFDGFNDGKPLDIKSKKQDLRAVVGEALSFMVRPGVSDVGRSTGAVGSGAHLGVLQLDTGDRKIVIGVSQVGFFLGIWHGSIRQTFYSWALAKTIDDLLFEATGKQLPKHVFDRLSGMAVIERNREIYYRDRGKNGSAEAQTKTRVANQIDQSTPQSVSRAFIRLMSTKKWRTALRCTTPESQTMLTGFLLWEAAFTAKDDVAKQESLEKLGKRYGSRGWDTSMVKNKADLLADTVTWLQKNVPKGQDSLVVVLPKDFADSRLSNFKIISDTATAEVYARDKSVKNKAYFQRIDGKWFVDLSRWFFNPVEGFGASIRRGSWRRGGFRGSIRGVPVENNSSRTNTPSKSVDLEKNKRPHNDNERYIKVYNCTDLLKSPSRSGGGTEEQLIHVIQTTIPSTHGQSKSERGISIAAFNGLLVVSASHAAHRDIQVLLKKLRQAARTVTRKVSTRKRRKGQPAQAPKEPGKNPTANSERRKAEITRLIDKLTEVSGKNVEVFSYTSPLGFLPVTRKSAVWGGIKQKTNPAMLKLISKGVDAIPLLLEHLTDARKTKLQLRFTEEVSLVRDDEYDPRRRDPEWKPKPFSLDQPRTKRYTVRVGDLCYAIIGQIVNRRLYPVRGQPTAIVIINSPVSTHALAKAVRKDWSGLTAEQHRQSLIDDVMRSQTTPTGFIGLGTLCFYYPKLSEPLALKFLARPVFDDRKFYRFLFGLVAETDARKWKGMIAAFKKKHGEQVAARIPWTIHSFYLSSPASVKKSDQAAARRILATVYPDFSAKKTPPFLNAVAADERTLLLEELSFSKSKKIQQAIKKIRENEKNGADGNDPSVLRWQLKPGDHVDYAVSHRMKFELDDQGRYNEYTTF